MGKQAVTTPLALPLLAALTPPHWHVEIVDENLRPRRSRRRPDLVGITALLTNHERAVELTRDFHSKGIPVVMGGPQVTTSPEARGAADAVVLGEAESTWPQLLDDFEQGRLQSTYQAAEPVDFARSPMPRWDLVPTTELLSCGVQVSRGCPYHCEFCVVHRLFGRGQRYRRVDDVIAEIQRLPLRHVTFVDDNLTGNRRYARELCERLIPLGITWSCQASIDVAYEPDLVRLMARAGCDAILFGLETLNTDSLAQARKRQNDVSRYQQALAHVHEAGIHVIGAFVVGFDADTLDTFGDVARFIEENRLSYVMINTLVPYPGSDLHERLRGEQRLTSWVPDLACGMYPMSSFRHMTHVDHFSRLLATLEEVYSYQSLVRKGPPLLGTGRFGRPPPVPVTAVTKARVISRMAAKLAGRDPEQRRFYRALFELLRSHRATPDAVVPYALTVESVRSYLHEVRRDTPRILSQLRRNDAELSRRESGPVPFSHRLSR
jgi:radical SAM superfamily enzyme YgiQ (UPF0313 family)